MNVLYEWSLLRVGTSRFAPHPSKLRRKHKAHCSRKLNSYQSRLGTARTAGLSALYGCLPARKRFREMVNSPEMMTRDFIPSQGTLGLYDGQKLPHESAFRCAHSYSERACDYFGAQWPSSSFRRTFYTSPGATKHACRRDARGWKEELDTDGRAKEGEKSSVYPSHHPSKDGRASAINIQIRA